jgi:ABC-type branched-subunit amino acid transport system ATPase component
MRDIKFENVITHLYEVFPDLYLGFNQRSKELYGERLAHVVYGSVLVEYVDLLADELDRPNSAFDDTRLKEIFDLIEELSGSDDIETVRLVETGFLEGLYAGKKGLKRFVAFMGPKTQYLIPGGLSGNGDGKGVRILFP